MLAQNDMERELYEGRLEANRERRELADHLERDLTASHRHQGLSETPEARTPNAGTNRFQGQTNVGKGTIEHAIPSPHSCVPGNAREPVSQGWTREDSRRVPSGLFGGRARDASDRYPRPDRGEKYGYNLAATCLTISSWRLDASSQRKIFQRICVQDRQQQRIQVFRGFNPANFRRIAAVSLPNFFSNKRIKSSCLPCCCPFISYVVIICSTFSYSGLLHTICWNSACSRSAKGRYVSTNSIQNGPARTAAAGIAAILAGRRSGAERAERRTGMGKPRPSW